MTDKQINEFSDLTFTQLLGYDLVATFNNNSKIKKLQEQLDQLKAELKSAKELREYTYDCCKRAGEELAKNSFEWDGKEKNLVVQAMELNERYDQLKVELETLKQYKASKQASYESMQRMWNNAVNENRELKAKNEKIEQCIIEQNRLVVGMTKEIETLTFKKYELLQTLAEIKEIAQYDVYTSRTDLCLKLNWVKKKISECEVEDELHSPLL